MLGICVTPTRYVRLMLAPSEVTEAAATWASLTRWERAELGRKLRRLGWTYSEIMEVLPVGKGTLSGWCGEIRLTEEQVEAIKARRPAGIRTGIPVDTQRKRRNEVARIRAEARGEVPARISDGLWLAGVILYWGEGSKTKHRLELTNSDERVLRLFIEWARTYVDSEAEFVLALHLHEGNDEVAAKAHWASHLGLEGPHYYKTFIKPIGTGHRKNKLAHGVCRVMVRRSGDAFHRTMSWIDTIADLYASPPLLPSLRVAGATGSATDS